MMIITPHLEYSSDINTETKEFLKTIKHHDLLTAKDNKFSYHNALKTIWNKDDIIIIEHDIVPTQDQLNELINCPYKDCTFDYNTFDSEKKQYRTHIKNGDRFCTKEDMYATHSGLGFIKLSKAFQSQRDKVFQESHFIFNNIDYNIFDIKPTLLHIHWNKVKHNHKYDFTKPNITTQYDLKDYIFSAIWGNVLVYKHKDEKGDNFILTCVHELRLPLTCRECMRHISEQYAQEHKELLING